MSPSGISLYSRPWARRRRARYKVKYPSVSFTFRSRITGTKIYIVAPSMAFSHGRMAAKDRGIKMSQIFLPKVFLPKET